MIKMKLFCVFYLHPIVHHFSWIWFPSDDPGFKDVTLSSDGVWKTADEQLSINAVCVYNIEQDNDCSKCFDKDFCRYTDRTRQETECVCPVNRLGDNCQYDMCDCRNGGYCRFNYQSYDTECVCPILFAGLRCEYGKKIMSCTLVCLKQDSRAN